MKHYITTAALVATLGLVGCQVNPKPPTNPLVNSQISQPVIQLQVKGGQLELVDKKPPRGCGSGQGAAGCIVTGLENISVARVELKGSGNYDLTRLWICDGKDKPAKVEQDCRLSSDGQAEFLVIAGATAGNPDAAGEVDLGKVDEFLIVNQNSFEADYFYLVEACRGEQNCTILDPRIRNGGRRVTF